MTTSEISLILKFPQSVLGSVISVATTQGKSLEHVVVSIVAEYVADWEQPNPATNDQLEVVLGSALQRVKNLQTGDQFELTDVVSKADWDSINRPDKIKIGKRFKKESIVPGSGFKFLYMQSNRHALYEKL